jgi:hypothetical protein
MKRLVKSLAMRPYASPQPERFLAGQELVNLS